MIILVVLHVGMVLIGQAVGAYGAERGGVEGSLFAIVRVGEGRGV